MDYVVVDDPCQTNRTEEEVHSHGRFLGLILPQDEDLLWIARESLRAPLPDGWEARGPKYPSAVSGETTFFANLKTNTITWDHPLDDSYRDLCCEEKAKKKWKGESHKIATLVSQVAFKSSSSSRIRSSCGEIYNVRVLVTQFLLPKYKSPLSSSSSSSLSSANSLFN